MSLASVFMSDQIIPWSYQSVDDDWAKQETLNILYTYLLNKNFVF